MKIAVLGTGIVGKTLAARLAGLGHEVYIGTRDPGQTLSSEKQDAYGNPPFKNWFASQTGIQLKSYAEATSTADLIVNCTSGQASLPALQAAGETNLSGKTLIDIANPLDFSNGMPPSLDPVNTDSLGEQIQAAFPEARVVKTLNTMNTLIMVDPSKIKGDHNVFLSGNDEGAKTEVREILHSFGWTDPQIIDLGDITTARGTEMLLPIWLQLWQALGTAEFNFHIQRG